jgi:hypothetical protein
MDPWYINEELEKRMNSPSNGVPVASLGRVGQGVSESSWFDALTMASPKALALRAVPVSVPFARVPYL